VTSPSPNPGPRLARWQTITGITLFVGYTGYYVCRSNLSVAAPLLKQDGWTKEDLGSIVSFGIVMYAIGKIVNGILADFLGGRRLFLAGMLGSILATAIFGFSGSVFASASSLAVFTAIWACNRFVQSMGWVALVKTAACWFPLGRQATIMGVLSMSFLLGDAGVRLYLGALIKNGMDWQSVFFVSAGTLSVIFCIAWFTLKSRASDLGLPEPDSHQTSVQQSDENACSGRDLIGLLRPFLTNKIFWLICVINFGLTLIRETFNFWTPLYLSETTQLDVGSAAISSLLFPLVGAGSALLAGFLSDGLGGRHGRVVVPALVGLTVTLIILSTRRSDAASPWIVLTLICLVSFFLMAPYTFLSGVMAVELGGKRGSSTAAGLIDSAGYFGAVISGWGIAKIATDRGWSAAFAFLAGVSVLTGVAGLIYWFCHENQLNQLRHEQTDKEPPHSG